MKVYIYNNCSTCKKAIQFLNRKDLTFESLPIRETPPTTSELKQMLDKYNGDLKRLFNTSGQDYRNLNLKEKLDTFTEEYALQLLSKNGNLIKRPFLISESIKIVGFKETEWLNLKFK